MLQFYEIALDANVMQIGITFKLDVIVYYKLR